MAKKANSLRVIEMTNVGAVGHSPEGKPGGFLSLDVSQPGLHVLTGANGCLHGSTVIFDPKDGSSRTVKERCESAVDFHVVSLGNDGCPVIAVAKCPIKYRPFAMIEFIIDDGSRIVVTPEHRFWRDERYVLSQSVFDEFREFGESLLSTISGIDLLAHLRDVSRSSRKPEGSRGDYLACPRFYDEQPLLPQEFCQELPPLRVDVLEHSHQSLPADDLEQELGYTRPRLLCDHRPTSHFFLRSLPLVDSESLAYEDNSLPDCDRASRDLRSRASGVHSHTSQQSVFHQHPYTANISEDSFSDTPLVDNRRQSAIFREPSRSHVETIPGSLAPVSSFGVPLTFRESLSCSVSPSGRNSWSAEHMVSRRVVEANMLPAEEYYDFHVPVHENYWAAGIFHHNSGKSTFLSGVQTLVSGEGKIPVADGCTEAEICGLGLRIVAGRNQKRYGQLEVNSLDDSGMSLATVVDPGLKDPVAADSKRIKSLIQISGIEASTALFTHLFSGEQEFKDIIQIGSMESKDLVDMASKIKRDVDAAALQLEKDVISNTAKAQGLKQSVPEVVEDTGESLADLEASLKVAQANCGVIRSNKAQAEAIRARHDESARLMAGASTIDVDAIVAEGKLISADIAEKAAKIEELQSKIEELQKELAVQKSQKESADKSKLDCLSRWNAAKQHNEKIVAIQDSMAQSLPDIPTDEEVAAYDSVVLDVTRRIESVKNADRISATLQQVAELVSKIEEDDLQGKRLRKIASQVESVLSNAVSETGNMRVNAKGRLVMDTDRGEELFSDLSVGERYRAVIQTAIAAMARRFPGQIPIATLPQEAYESLQPSVREELKVMCHEQGIVLITAVAADNPEIDVEFF